MAHARARHRIARWSTHLSRLLPRFGRVESRSSGIGASLAPALYLATASPASSAVAYESRFDLRDSVRTATADSPFHVGSQQRHKQPAAQRRAARCAHIFAPLGSHLRPLGFTSSAPGVTSASLASPHTAWDPESARTARPTLPDLPLAPLAPPQPAPEAAVSPHPPHATSPPSPTRSAPRPRPPNTHVYIDHGRRVPLSEPGSRSGRGAVPTPQGAFSDVSTLERPPTSQPSDERSVAPTCRCVPGLCSQSADV